ncbi:MAG: putative 2OG-Fe(II) oxygenase [Alphaproteobacteria bacterium]|nr:putative 2OG-Fe(II) oxygenase [Alphaproteobacteria bacterium]
MSTETVQIGPLSVPIWPKGVRIHNMDPMVYFVVFPDNDLIRSVAGPKLLAGEEAFRKAEGDRWVGAGGAKVRDIGSWPCPAMMLLHERAKLAFKMVTRSKTAEIDDCWASVYRKGEFIGPHAHRRTEMSLVYHLEPPDPKDRAEFNGALGITDPRVAKCCPTSPGCVTSQIYPPLDPGTLVMFPSFVVHYVTPYLGDAHRISIAWNIAREKLEGNVADQPLL